MINIDNLGKYAIKGNKLSEEHRNKISKTSTGRKLSEETIEKIRSNPNFGMKGKHHSEESKKKIKEKRALQIMKPMKEETKRKIGLKHKGKIVSEETKRKISLVSKGRITWNKGTKGIMKAWNKGKSGYKVKPCSEERKRKIGIANKGKEGFKGEKNYFWNGGGNFEPYTTDWTKTLRKAIRERDHYTCQLCGKSQGDKTFDVHHIDYNKKNCNSDNLITLCRKCHGLTTFDREKWTKYFKGIMR